MTFKKAFAVWIMAVFVFIGILVTAHAWNLWHTEGSGSLVTIPILGNLMSLEVTFYLIAASAFSLAFVGGICYAVFRSNSLEIPLYQLSKSFEEKLGQKSEEIQESTNQSIAKLGLREFQIGEDMKNLQKQTEHLYKKLEKGLEKCEKNLANAQKKLEEIEQKTDGIGKSQKQLSELKKKLQSAVSVDNSLKNINRGIREINSVPKPYLASTDQIQLLEGKILKKDTVRRLKAVGFSKIEDLLLKSPMDIVITEAMSENEAKNLQSILQLLMVPGVGHEDAMLLLKSGVNSKQELGLQDTFSLGARISKVAEHYLEEGKIKENEKPSLEEIASWIKWAKLQ
ncbi:MAG: DUF4332 domain-containing protein [Candidatus Bathyarchaeota archaeon]|nr:DUF4332 domain-containing protein [Candidatus Bathyarchaeota archaeon]